jgi:hypothetical protein
LKKAGTNLESALSIEPEWQLPKQALLDLDIVADLARKK